MVGLFRITAMAGAVVLSVLSLAVTPAAQAFHEPDGAELVHERTIEGPFWFVYRVHVADEGNVASWEIEPQSENRAQTGYGLWLVPVADQRNPSFIIGTGGPAVTEVDVSRDDPVDLEVRQGPLFGGSGRTSGFATTTRDLPLGDYWLVIVNTSPWTATADIRLYLSEEVDVVATAQGTTGGLLRETDFESPEPRTHIRVGASVVVNPQMQHHHLVDARAPVAIENSLFGLFRASGGDPNDISYITPDGTEHTERFVFTARDPGAWSSG